MALGSGGADGNALGTIGAVRKRRGRNVRADVIEFHDHADRRFAEIRDRRFAAIFEQEIGVVTGIYLASAIDELHGAPDRGVALGWM